MRHLAHHPEQRIFCRFFVKGQRVFRALIFSHQSDQEIGEVLITGFGLFNPLLNK